MAISIKTYQEILGSIARKLVADSVVSDINPGSVLSTLMEAVATNDFENNAAILSLLDLQNIDSIANSDLDLKAQDLNLPRKPAQKATGFIKVSDSSITKKSTNLYSLKPAPIAGQTTLYVNNAEGWDLTGSLYLGRGTSSFEGPIIYSSITFNNSYYTITLSSALQKDHLLSDQVVNAQGTTDRVIRTGTKVKIPANNVNPEIVYTTLREAIIAAGETEVADIPIISTISGYSGNAGINTITTFDTLPFNGAVVTNTIPLVNGLNVEDDDSLRERIKSYTTTLARGTRQAILNAVIGLSNTEEGKQVVSAYIKEPSDFKESAYLYIDDGTGFQPSYKGQNIDVIVSEAKGGEQYVQLSNYPLLRPKVFNLVNGPLTLIDGMILSVKVDDVQEDVIFKSTEFFNINSVNLFEIVNVINAQASSFKAELTSNSSRMALYPTSEFAETIQVLPQGDTLDSYYGNLVLKFNTRINSYITLYKNSTLLSESSLNAKITTKIYSDWNIDATGNLIIAVDGTPEQDRTFSLSDFNTYSYSALNSSSWAAILNSKFAGLNAVVNADDTLSLYSNKTGSSSSISLLGGSLAQNLFLDFPISSSGKDSQFTLNRQNGTIKLVTPLVKGDVLIAGSEDNKGNYTSTTSSNGYFNLGVDYLSRLSRIVFVLDSSSSSRKQLNISLNQAFTIQRLTAEEVAITSTTGTFDKVMPGDFLYVNESANWFSGVNATLYKIERKPSSTSVIVKNSSISLIPTTRYLQNLDDVIAFSASEYPQYLNLTGLPSSNNISLSDLAKGLMTQIGNLLANVYKVKYLKLTSTNEEGNIFVPISSGYSKDIFVPTTKPKDSLASHNAYKISGNLYKTFKFKMNGTGFFGEYNYEPISGYTSSVGAINDPNNEIVAVTSPLSGITVFDKLYMFGSTNHKLSKSIYGLDGNNIHLKQDLPPFTLFEHQTNESLYLLRNLSFNANDSLSLILDNDNLNKTVNINFNRLCKVKSSPIPLNNAFSAWDMDGETGTDFDKLDIWGRNETNTNFDNYTLVFRARNWYASGGSAASNGKLLVRAKEYGVNGDTLKFKIQYPTLANQEEYVSYTNNPGVNVVTYNLASDISASINAVAGSRFKIVNEGSNIFRYELFSGSINLASVNNVEYIVSITNDSGFTSANKGQFKITQINNIGTPYFKVYNPNGSATNPGNQEKTTLTTRADIQGIAANKTIQGSLYIQSQVEGGNDISIEYVDMGGPGGSESVTVLGKAITVNLASGITTAQTVSTLINANPASFALVTTIPISGQNLIPQTAPMAPTLLEGGVNRNTLDAKYFKIYDANGSVAVWFDTTGSTIVPIHGCNRGIRVLISPNDTADIVTTTMSAALLADGSFGTEIISGTQIKIINLAYLSVPDATAETSGFTINSIEQGITNSHEYLNSSEGIQMFKLVRNTAGEIADFITSNSVLEATAINNLFISYSTAQEKSILPGDGELAYGFTSSDSYISLYDSTFGVSKFENGTILVPKRNFTLKKDVLSLFNTPNSIYQIHSAPNYGSTELGEYFKLIPSTIDNVNHHISHKALSYLNIIGSSYICDNFKRIQIKSNQIGSNSAVSVIGGKANSNASSIFGSGESYDYSGTVYGVVNINVTPSSFNNGDLIEIYNEKPAPKPSYLEATSKIRVEKINTTDSRLVFENKSISLNKFTRLNNTDVSNTYSRNAGSVWRLQKTNSGSGFSTVAATNGVGSGPVSYTSNGGTNSSLKTVITSTGSGTTKQSFEMYVVNPIAQGDFYYVENGSGLFSIWFAIDGNTTEPTSGIHTGAAYKLKIDILSSDSENQVIAKLASVLTTNTDFINIFPILGSQIIPTPNFTNVKVGDVLYVNDDLVNPTNVLSSNWPNSNKCKTYGAKKQPGFTIVGKGVDYIDYLNPLGVAANDLFIDTGIFNVGIGQIHKYNIPNGFYREILFITRTGDDFELITNGEHLFNIGDSITIVDCPLFDGDISVSVVGIPSHNIVNFTSAIHNLLSVSQIGRVINGSVTKYAYTPFVNGFASLKYISGPVPNFYSNGLTSEDTISFSGDNFKNLNEGSFKVLTVSETEVIFKNENALKEVDTLTPFNYSNLDATWLSGKNYVTGSAGCFKYVNEGDYVKKEKDSDESFVRVSGCEGGDYATTTQLNLGGLYVGSSEITRGVSLNQNLPGQGVEIIDDYVIGMYSGESLAIGDTINIPSILEDTWFSNYNAGIYSIKDYGVNANYEFYLVVANPNAVNQTITLGSYYNQIKFIEDPTKPYSTIRTLATNAVNADQNQYRVMYFYPADKLYKLDRSYGTKVRSLHKLEFDVDTSIGIDGYNYYTGLLQQVQRTIDSFDKDLYNYPGYKAVGSKMEILSPLIKKVALYLEVITKDGINLKDISENIKSIVINYINNLKIGESVVLSEVIARVMSIKGVKSASLTYPLMDEKEIPINHTEKAYTDSINIIIS